MALCHDERDYALGFSRYNPSAGRSRILNRQRRQASLKRLEAYIATLTPVRRKAYRSVELCLVAIGRLFEERGEMIHIPTKDLHRFFPVFARAVGIRGPLYRLKSGTCPAVEIYLLDDGSKDSNKKSFWLINPYLHHSRSSTLLKKRVMGKRISEAARSFCRAWLPDWNWR